MKPAIICVQDAQNSLGEGPYWHAPDQWLYWCDIKLQRLHWLVPDTGEHRVVALPAPASGLAGCVDGDLLLATARGLVLFDPASEAIRDYLPVDLGPGFRSNEAKADVHGRFWWSSMDDNEGERPGRVFVCHPDGRNEVAVEGVHIANTASCSPDGRLFYLADTAAQAIYLFDMDPASGALSNRRIFVDLTGQDAFPDGSAVDDAGFVWNCQWGAWRIVRYAPDGSVDAVIPLPVQQPTSCAFGGPDLRTLYITSARVGLSQAQLQAQPLAGGVFAFETEVRGLALPLLRQHLD